LTKWDTAVTLQAFKTIHFKEKSHLFKEGDKADCAYIIQKGSVRISKKGPSGRNITIATAAKGSIVGEMAIISDCPRSATVTVVEPVDAIAITKRSFDARLDAVDPFLYSLITTVITRLRKTSDHTVALYEKVKAADTITQPSRTKTKIKPIDKKNFAHVNFMLADPNQQTRNSLRSGLFGFGFRDIHDISNFFQISEELSRKHYDLLMLDTAYGLRKITELIHNIRHGFASKNPFVTIVILTENNDDEVHKNMRFAGCDDILLKPLSLSSISEKIEALCRVQRNFVVTRDYAGPDRVNFKEEKAEDAPRFEAPNTLAAKVIQEIKVDNIEQGLSKNITRLNELKMERHLVQLAWLLNRLNPEKGAPYDLHFLLEKMDDLLKDLTNRANNSRFQTSTLICCEMRDLVSTLKDKDSPPIEQWHGINAFYKELLENIPLIQGSEAFKKTTVSAML
jgi:DNA-binding response OmpR family regulator